MPGATDGRDAKVTRLLSAAQQAMRKGLTKVSEVVIERFEAEGKVPHVLPLSAKSCSLTGKFN